MAAPSNVSWGSMSYISNNSSKNGIKLGIKTSVTNASASAVTVSVEVWIYTKWSVKDGTNSIYFNDNTTSASTLVKSNFSISTSNDSTNNDVNYVQIYSTSFNVDKGSSAMTRNLAAKISGIMDNKTGGNLSASHSTSYTVPALPSYTVTFTDGLGNTLKTQTVYHGKSATAPSNPTRTGYTFGGWSGSYTNISKATTVTATWTINSYNLSINPNGGYRASDGNTGTVIVSKNYGATEAISERKRTNYCLTGYTLTNTASGSTSNVGGATFSFNNDTKEGTFTQGTVACTLTANWVLDAYVITYIDNGGKSGPGTQTIIIGESGSISEASPIRDGYDFVGWSTNIDSLNAEYLPGSPITPSSDITLYAIWTPWTYAVLFDLNGGYGPTPSAINLKTDLTATIGNEIPLSINSKVFECWNTSADGSGISYYPGDNVKNLSLQQDDVITLYAMYYCSEIYFNSDASIESYGFKKDASLSAPAFYRNGVIAARDFEYSDDIMFEGGILYARSFIEKVKVLICGSSPALAGTIITDINNNIIVDANGYVLIEG